MATSFSDDHPATPAPTSPAVEPGTNADPLTGEPGAHPVGTSLGAVGAGAAGAALGIVGGPIGVVVGAIVGAVAGAIIGKETAETINPTDPGALLARDHADTATPPTPIFTPGVSDTSTFLAGGSSDPLLQSMAASAIAAGMATLETPRAASDTAVSHEGHHHTAETAAAAATGSGDAASSSRPSSRLHRITAEPATLPPPVELVVRESYPEDNVREAAYFRYLHRVQHGLPGDELTDWTEAEQEVLRG